MGCHQETNDYVARRTAEGKTKTEIMCCLKRYIAREVFPHLLAASPGPGSRQERPGGIDDLIERGKSLG
jgi:hypothetical protein